MSVQRSVGRYRGISSASWQNVQSMLSLNLSLDMCSFKSQCSVGCHSCSVPELFYIFSTSVRHSIALIMTYSVAKLINSSLNPYKGFGTDLILVAWNSKYRRIHYLHVHSTQHAITAYVSSWNMAEVIPSSVLSTLIPTFSFSYLFSFEIICVKYLLNILQTYICVIYSSAIYKLIINK